MTEITKKEARRQRNPAQKHPLSLGQAHTREPTARLAKSSCQHHWVASSPSEAPSCPAGQQSPKPEPVQAAATLGA